MATTGGRILATSLIPTMSMNYSVPTPQAPPPRGRKPGAKPKPKPGAKPKPKPKAKARANPRAKRLVNHRHIFFRHSSQRANLGRRRPTSPPPVRTPRNGQSYSRVQTLPLLSPRRIKKPLRLPAPVCPTWSRRTNPNPTAQLRSQKRVPLEEFLKEDLRIRSTKPTVQVAITRPLRKIQVHFGSLSKDLIKTRPPRGPGIRQPRAHLISLRKIHTTLASYLFTYPVLRRSPTRSSSLSNLIQSRASR